MEFKQLEEKDTDNIANTYARFKVAISHGKGSTLYDCNEKKYIDFTSGIGVNTFGASDDIWVNAVCEQAHKIQHISNLYYTEPQIKLAELICAKTNMKKVFFSNSGAEANEGAIKTARKYSHDKYNEQRSDIITLDGSFHGRTIATLSATGQDKFHKNFGPFVNGFKYAKINDLDALSKMIDQNTCAIMIETIQGEGGVNNLDKDFIIGIEKLCKDNDLMFIVDEVQTGNGRTGYYFSYMEYGVKPNIVTTAKGIAGGLPMGAVLFDEKTEHVLNYGDHGTTYGGNPIVAAAAYSTVSRIDDKLMKHVRECRKIIEEELQIPGITCVTGKGLMVGVGLKDKKAIDVANKCILNGLIVLTAHERIRLLPPLNISFEELKEGLQILKDVISE